MPRGKLNKRYTAESKKQIIETMMEGLVEKIYISQNSIHSVDADVVLLYNHNLESGDGSRGSPIGRIPAANQVM